MVFCCVGCRDMRLKLQEKVEEKKRMWNSSKIGVERVMGHVSVPNNFFHVNDSYVIFVIFLENWLVEHINFFIYLGSVIKGLTGKTSFEQKY